MRDGLSALRGVRGVPGVRGRLIFPFFVGVLGIGASVEFEREPKFLRVSTETEALIFLLAVSSGVAAAFSDDALDSRDEIDEIDDMEARFVMNIDGLDIFDCEFAGVLGKMEGLFFLLAFMVAVRRDSWRLFETEPFEGHSSLAP